MYAGHIGQRSQCEVITHHCDNQKTKAIHASVYLRSVCVGGGGDTGGSVIATTTGAFEI